MRTITLKSQDRHVPVAPSDLQEFHAVGMSWGEYERLHETKTHHEALEAHKAKWTALGYGYSFTQ